MSYSMKWRGIRNKELSEARIKNYVPRFCQSSCHVQTPSLYFTFIQTLKNYNSYLIGMEKYLDYFCTYDSEEDDRQACICRYLPHRGRAGQRPTPTTIAKNS
ncbi:hypothetical protein WN51_01984 [Melipona quadrifasciata]|uniref:Uncharacterized protein n=1 Tax=Melipona quadrifasciata TaxID=166423 RepID=A0A0M9ABY3_9HYME|nr:hypothetical protein WN51_01984 [Melipona quadrifasciata]